MLHVSFPIVYIIDSCTYGTMASPTAFVATAVKPQVAERSLGARRAPGDVRLNVRFRV